MNLLKALATVSSMTLVSRIFGFIRDAVIARIFGAGLYTDAFFVAFTIPNLLRRLFAEGAFSQAFVPILAYYKNRREHEHTKSLINHTATLLALALFVVTVIGVVAAPIIIGLSAPGFTDEPEKFAVTVDMLRITFPYIFFISLVALAAGILNTYGRFMVPAFTPVLLNISFLTFALALLPFFSEAIMALAWAVFFGGVLQLAFQVPFLARLGLLPRWSLDLKDEGVWRILKLMGPAVFGVSISQISILINTAFASYLVTGSVSWLYYADRLMTFPTGLLGAALGTILLPSLAKYHAAKSPEEYSRLLDWGLRITLLLALPAALALALLAVPLIATLFHYGRFSVEDVFMTQHALLAYSVGLLGLILVKVLAPGFYARQDIKTPVKIGIMTLIATQLMNLVFIWPLKHAGLALAISLGATLNAGWLYYKLKTERIYQPQPGWKIFALKVATSLAVMAAVLWFASGSDDAWIAASALERIAHLTVLVLLALLSYLGTLWLLGFRPQDFVQRVVAH
ncbi:MAG: murein biosynthesis integral membrane protein MurJ [Burkholderiales bacterium]